MPRKGQEWERRASHDLKLCRSSEPTPSYHSHQVPGPRARGEDGLIASAVVFRAYFLGRRIHFNVALLFTKLLWCRYFRVNLLYVFEPHISSKHSLPPNYLKHVCVVEFGRLRPAFPPYRRCQRRSSPPKLRGQEEGRHHKADWKRKGFHPHHSYGPGFVNAIHGFNSFGLISFAVLLGLVLGERCGDDDIIFDILEGFASALLRISQLLAWRDIPLASQILKRALADPAPKRIVWAPGHQGLRSNEAADAAAGALTHRAPHLGSYDSEANTPLLRFQEILTYYRDTHHLYPAPAKGMSKAEERTLRRLQTGFVNRFCEEFDVRFFTLLAVQPISALVKELPRESSSIAFEADRAQLPAATFAPRPSDRAVPGEPVTPGAFHSESQDAYYENNHGMENCSSELKQFPNADENEKMDATQSTLSSESSTGPRVHDTAAGSSTANTKLLDNGVQKNNAVCYRRQV
ncbi:hypothetical protein HPB51_017421 [Rhipicephalus microplus]|uniref:Uncharacterized protein n=1 Tax=Rhipicephalus microplus TaxID=6941 RepID=A0A9J6D5R5_RHIMP|nr:hypothetical protein HPB51_017421 [Rhipicephalus microplus]